MVREHLLTVDQLFFVSLQHIVNKAKNLSSCKVQHFLFLLEFFSLIFELDFSFWSSVWLYCVISNGVFKLMHFKYDSKINRISFRFIIFDLNILSSVVVLITCDFGCNFFLLSQRIFKILLLTIVRCWIKKK